VLLKHCTFQISNLLILHLQPPYHDNTYLQQPTLRHLPRHEEQAPSARWSSNSADGPFPAPEIGHGARYLPHTPAITCAGTSQHRKPPSLCQTAVRKPGQHSRSYCASSTNQQRVVRSLWGRSAASFPTGAWHADAAHSRTSSLQMSIQRDAFGAARLWLRLH
jgi:hypothetical protein